MPTTRMRSLALAALLLAGCSLLPTGTPLKMSGSYVPLDDNGQLPGACGIYQTYSFSGDQVNVDPVRRPTTPGWTTERLTGRMVDGKVVLTGTLRAPGPSEAGESHDVRYELRRQADGRLVGTASMDGEPGSPITLVPAAKVGTCGGSAKPDPAATGDAAATSDAAASSATAAADARATD